jgi:hypothetical protein
LTLNPENGVVFGHLVWVNAFALERLLVLLVVVGRRRLGDVPDEERDGVFREVLAAVSGTMCE